VIAYQRSADRSSIDQLGERSNIKVVQLDATDPDSVRKAVEETRKVTDKIDVLVNNAAINPGKFTLVDS
jgi:NAD(P)-dependent dehydrogenase (short-subunit alcohol dehydrogenase family)